MINELTDIRSSFSKSRGFEHIKAVELYPGIELSCFTLAAENLSVHHAALDHIFEINYCRFGRVGWKMGNGNSVYLGQKDFSLHTLKACADSVMSLPTGTYEGLTISIDLRALTDNPPEILSGTGITGTFLYDQLSRQADQQSAFYGKFELKILSYLPHKIRRHNKDEYPASFITKASDTGSLRNSASCTVPVIVIGNTSSVNCLSLECSMFRGSIEKHSLALRAIEYDDI